MWQRLLEWMEHLRRSSELSGAERRVIEARERFWAEVREGEREAAARSDS